MSVCTSTVTMKPPKVDCDSASANTRLVSASAPAPPCSRREHQAQQAGVAELAQHVARHAAVALPLLAVRLDLARNEARDLLAQQFVLGREVDVVHHMRNTPNFGASGIGCVQARADRQRQHAPRVGGPITPSSHSRALA